jgi:hypothetical protein
MHWDRKLFFIIASEINDLVQGNVRLRARSVVIKATLPPIMCEHDAGAHLIGPVRAESLGIDVKETIQQTGRLWHGLQLVGGVHCEYLIEILACGRQHGGRKADVDDGSYKALDTERDEQGGMSGHGMHTMR